MNFIKNNIWTFAAIMLFAMFGLVDNAAAALSTGTQSNSVLGVAAGKALDVFKATRTIVFIVGGFGLVGIACAAIFGKMQWKWFAFLAIGLAILAAAGAVVNYATTSGSTVTGTGNNINDLESNY